MYILEMISYSFYEIECPLNTFNTLRQKLVLLFYDVYKFRFALFF